MYQQLLAFLFKVFVACIFPSTVPVAGLLMGWTVLRVRRSGAIAIKGNRAVRGSDDLDVFLDDVVNDLEDVADDIWHVNNDIITRGFHVVPCR